MPLSDAVHDKLYACLNQSWAESEYLFAPDYYDACAAWWDNLTAEQQEIGLAVMQAFSFSNPENAEKAAAALPPAPACPLLWYTDSKHRRSPVGIEYREAARLLAEIIERHQAAKNAGDVDQVAALKEQALLLLQRVDSLHKQLQVEYLAGLGGS